MSHSIEHASRAARSRVRVRLLLITVIVAPALLTGGPLEATEPRVVTAVFKAFIPNTVPAGVVLTAGEYAGLTAVRGPHPRVGKTCYVSDERGFTSDASASARVTGTVVVDMANGSLRSKTAVSSPTHEVNCETGEVLCTLTGTPRIAVTNFKASGDNASMRVDIAGNNPCVRGSPDIDMSFHLSLFKMGDKNVDVSLTGHVDPVPSYEAYTHVNDCPPKTLFQQSVNETRFLQRGFLGLSGAPDVLVRGSTALDPDECGGATVRGRLNYIHEVEQITTRDDSSFRSERRWTESMDIDIDFEKDPLTRDLINKNTRFSYLRDEDVQYHSFASGSCTGLTYAAKASVSAQGEPSYAYLGNVSTNTENYFFFDIGGFVASGTGSDTNYCNGGSRTFETSLSYSEILTDGGCDGRGSDRLPGHLVSQEVQGDTVRFSCSGSITRVTRPPNGTPESTATTHRVRVAGELAVTSGPPPDRPPDSPPSS